MANREVIFETTGKSAKIPQSFIDKVNQDPLALKQYAVQSGQLSYEEAYGMEPEYKPEVSGPVEAGLIGAGRTVDRIGSNISQLLGGEERAQEEMGKQQDIERLAQPVKEEFPKSSFAGEQLPYFAAPGGKVAQVMFGAAEGALEGDTLEERLANAALGSLFAFTGQKLGDKAGDQVKNLIGKIRNTPDAQARRQLQQAAVPLTLSQKGSPIAEFFERMKFVLTKRQPLSGQQQKAINKLAAKAIGMKADDLTKPVLSEAHSKIGNVFENVANALDKIKLNEQHLGKLQGILGKVERDGFDVPRTQKAINNLTDLFKSPSDLNGKTVFDARQKLGALSRALWKKGEGLDAELIDDAIELLDDVIYASAEGSAIPEKSLRELATARAQWRFLKALRTGKAINDQGDISFNAMDSAMRKIYPGFDVGKGPSGDAGNFGKSLDAIRRLQKPPRSSGTAENLIAAGALPLLGFGVTGGEGEGLAGGLGLAALGLTGGGAGGQLGGGSGRALANLLMQQYDFQGRKIEK